MYFRISFIFICSMETTNFNPNGIGLDNGHFIGLPFTEETANVVLISVPWDVTVSYNDGTSKGPQNVLESSTQLDLVQHGMTDAWKLGVYLRPSDEIWLSKNKELRKKSIEYIQFLEAGGLISQSPKFLKLLEEINNSCETLHNSIYSESKELIRKGKLPGILGGEHSSPMGLLKALHEKHADFGILQIDAHMDLRNSYEGFTYSHASIFHNVMSNKYASKLVQVGVRDYCEEEMLFAKENNITVYYDEDLKSNSFEGLTWQKQCLNIIENLPKKVYISFDIDGLIPSLCPGTGTPVPGGLGFSEAIYLLKQVVESGRKIIGFDLCEVGGKNEWDGNVGARVLYNLCNYMSKSNGLI